MRRHCLLLFAIVTLSGCDQPAGKTATSSTTVTAPRPKIAMVPKGTTHMFWKSVERGARRAADEFDVDLVWKGPLKESDRGEQIQLVQQFATQDLAGIGVAPLDRQALLQPIRAAGKREIPVAIFDSSLDGEAGTDYVSFVATDNQAAGALGGAHLAELVGDGGAVVLLKYDVGSASTEKRETGALEALRAGQAEILVDNRYSGATAGEAKTAALNMLDQIQAADGIFCSNESNTMGMLLALRQENLVGQKKFVGFDSSPLLVEALRAGEIDALVVQNPERMGYETVRALARTHRGESVQPVIDTGATLVTRDNMDDPDVAALLK